MLKKLCEKKMLEKRMSLKQVTFTSSLAVNFSQYSNMTLHEK